MLTVGNDEDASDGRECQEGGERWAGGLGGMAGGTVWQARNVWACSRALLGAYSMPSKVPQNKQGRMLTITGNKRIISIVTGRGRCRRNQV